MSLKCYFSASPSLCSCSAPRNIHNIHLKVRPSAKRPMSRRPCCRRRRGVVTQRPARTKFSGTSFSKREGKWSVKNLCSERVLVLLLLFMWESLRSLLCHPKAISSSQSNSCSERLKKKGGEILSFILV